MELFWAGAGCLGSACPFDSLLVVVVIIIKWMILIALSWHGGLTLHLFRPTRMTSQQRRIMRLPNFFVSTCLPGRPSFTTWKCTASSVRQTSQHSGRQTGKQTQRWTGRLMGRICTCLPNTCLDRLTDWLTVIDWMLVTDWLTHCEWLQLVW